MFFLRDSRNRRNFQKLTTSQPHNSNNKNETEKLPLLPFWKKYPIPYTAAQQRICRRETFIFLELPLLLLALLRRSFYFFYLIIIIFLRTAYRKTPNRYQTAQPSLLILTFCSGITNCTFHIANAVPKVGTCSVNTRTVALKYCTCNCVIGYREREK